MSSMDEFPEPWQTFKYQDDRGRSWDVGIATRDIDDRINLTARHEQRCVGLWLRAPRDGRALLWAIDEARAWLTEQRVDDSLNKPLRWKRDEHGNLVENTEPSFTFAKKPPT